MMLATSSFARCRGRCGCSLEHAVRNKHPYRAAFAARGLASTRCSVARRPERHYVRVWIGVGSNPRHACRRNRAIILDEFQDTSAVQFALLTQLAPHGHVTAVGDDDQSIFAFSGAQPANFLRFVDRFGPLFPAPLQTPPLQPPKRVSQEHPDAPPTHSAESARCHRMAGSCGNCPGSPKEPMAVPDNSQRGSQLSGSVRACEPARPHFTQRTGFVAHADGGVASPDTPAVLYTPLCVRLPAFRCESGGAGESPVGWWSVVCDTATQGTGKTQDIAPPPLAADAVRAVLMDGTAQHATAPPPACTVPAVTGTAGATGCGIHEVHACASPPPVPRGAFVKGDTGGVGDAGVGVGSAAGRVVTLGVNYRCPGNVVEAASALVAANTERLPKELQAAQGLGASLLSTGLLCMSQVDIQWSTSRPRSFLLDR